MIISTVVLLHFCIKISNPKYILNNDYNFFAVYIYKKNLPGFFPFYSDFFDSGISLYLDSWVVHTRRGDGWECEFSPGTIPKKASNKALFN